MWFGILVLEGSIRQQCPVRGLTFDSARKRGADWWWRSVLHGDSEDSRALQPAAPALWLEVCWIAFVALRCRAPCEWLLMFLGFCSGVVIGLMAISMGWADLGLRFRFIDLLRIAFLLFRLHLDKLARFVVQFNLELPFDVSLFLYSAERFLDLPINLFWSFFFI